MTQFLEMGQYFHCHLQEMADNPQEFRFFLNAIAFSIILFVIFLRRSMKERERQRELASKWKTLNDKIKAARSILIMRQLAKKKRYQRERKRPKLSKVQSVSSSMWITCLNQHQFSSALLRTGLTIFA